MSFIIDGSDQLDFILLHFITKEKDMHEDSLKVSLIETFDHGIPENLSLSH